MQGQIQEFFIGGRQTLFQKGLLIFLWNFRKKTSVSKVYFFYCTSAVDVFVCDLKSNIHPLSMAWPAKIIPK